MSSFDPSVISDIGSSGPDISGSIAKGFQLKDLINDEQMGQLKLSSAKQSAADESTAKGILKTSDIRTEKGIAEASEKLTRAGQPDKAMELRKYGQQAASGELDNQIKQLEVAEKSQGAIVGIIDPIVSKADEMRRSGSSDAMIQAFIQAQTPLAMQQIQQANLPPQAMKQIMGQLGQGPLSYDKLKSFETSSKSGLDRIKSRQEELKFGLAEKAQATKDASESEKERHDRTTEATAETRAKASAAGFTPEVGNLLGALTERGVSLPAGMRSKAQQVATLEGLMARNPGKSPNEIADMVKSGQISMGVSKTEGSVLGRREAAILPVEKSITKPGGFLDQAQKAVDEVDFPKLKAAGGFESWSKDQLSDPKLTAYKAAVAELRAEYSIVLSKGGQVTDAARHEAAKVIPDLITKDQFKRIRQTVLSGIEASKGGVEESISQTEKGATSDEANPADIQSLLNKYK